MTGSIVAARYGEAVFALAKEKEKIELWLEQLQEIVDLVEANAELRELLQSGMIEKKQKKEYNIFRSIRDCNKHFIFDIKQKYNVFLTNVLLLKKRHAYCFLCNLDKCCFISRNWIKKYFPALESPGGVFLLCFKPKKVFKSPISLMQYS